MQALPLPNPINGAKSETASTCDAEQDNLASLRDGQKDSCVAKQGPCMSIAAEDSQVLRHLWQDHCTELLPRPYLLPLEYDCMSMHA